jgi:hypothetical protein
MTVQVPVLPLAAEPPSLSTLQDTTTNPVYTGESSGLSFEDKHTQVWFADRGIASLLVSSFVLEEQHTTRAPHRCRLDLPIDLRV